METRKNDLLLDLEGLVLKKTQQLDVSVVQQLPSNEYVLSRYFTLMSEKAPRLPEKQSVVLNELAKELRNLWIFMNVSPITVKHVKKKLKSFVESFETHRKTSKNRKSFLKIHEKCILELKNGFDIRATTKEVIDSVTRLYDVKETESEENLYRDNCVPDPLTGVCSRKRWCGEVDSGWWAKAKKRRKRVEYEEELRNKRNAKEEKEERETKEILSEEKLENEEIPQSSNDTNDENFEPMEFQSKTMKHKESITAKEEFPKIHVRKGYKTINKDILEALVVIESVFKVEARKAPHLLAYVGRKIFNQDWTVASDECVESSDKTPDGKKKRRKPGFLDDVLPSRPAIAHAVDDFSLLSFADMAESISEAAESDKVVTYGTDDTKKAAGKKVFDMKTNHISIIGEDHQRETFTSGFYENASHTGVISADTIRHDLAKMAVLTGNSYDDMLGFIDFFMTDRASDSTTMLDNLGVDESKRLKCNAHIVLSVDVAIDKVFKDTEAVIGVSSLISQNASHVFTSKSSSIWTLGLIAFAKLLSPSHSKESVSLYTHYKQFLKDDSESGSKTSVLSGELLKKGFKGFQSNRFGRTGELSQLVVEHQELIRKFFDEIVDEHANRLVLAVHAYQRSEWFMLGCKIASEFHNSVVLPIKKIIGIDEFKDVKVPNRSWQGLKAFFKDLLQMLGNYTPEGSYTQGENILIKKVAKEVKEKVEGQLSVMKFYRDDVDEKTKSMMKQAPTTNCGCEHEFAHGDNDLKKSGGSTQLKTVSDKHVIKQNRLYSKEKWTSLTDTEREQKWRWARSSDKAKMVRTMEKEFRGKLEALKLVSYEEKKVKKMKLSAAFQEALSNCKKHGGPITMTEVDRIKDLTYEQVLLEVKFLKKSTAPELRIKRKVDGKMVNFTRDELAQQMKDVLMPSHAPKSIESLLMSTFVNDTDDKPPDNDDEQGEKTTLIGRHGFWREKTGTNDYSVGVLIDASTLQTFKQTRFGYFPHSTHEDASDWELVSVISEDNYYYVEKNDKVYLLLDE